MLSTKLILILIIIFISLGMLLINNPQIHNNFMVMNPKVSQDLDDQNEDTLSLYQIPSDVQAALNRAKESGNPVLGIRADGPSYHIPILMYHYVEHVQDSKDTIRISLNTSPEILDQQIKTLLQANYNFINASDLADILDGIKPAPPKPIMLTFDDSYRDFYTDAFPILQKYQVKSVQYVITGFLNQPNHLTDSQLMEIAKSGLVEIGAHTVHHLALGKVTSETAKSEIDNSKVQLEQKLGLPVTTFAYPYGSFNITDIQLTKEAGFRTVVSTIPGAELSNSLRFFAHRLRPGNRTGQSLINLTQSN